jgi:alanyl-tRNA synthetase
VIGKVKDYVVLDRTAFYPTSGGQLHDKGILEGKNGSFEVTEVKKVGKVVLHKVKGVDIGERVLGKIDKERRMRLMKHHTATHIINGSCRRILGEHIWQAGAEKNVEKGRIDVTHYKKIEKEELRSIERLANEVVEKGLKVEKIFMKRNEAEKKFGFRIYQGGYVPGNLLRIVRINGFDVEACGGTHVDNTREVGKIKIIGSKKIQDGVIRIEFSCGESAEGFLVKESEIIEKIKNLIPYEGKIDLERLSENFRVRKEELFDTIKRFLKDYREKKWKIEKLEDIIGEKGSFSSKYQEIKGEKIYDLFEIWKMQDKDIELLEKKIVEKTFAELAETKEDFILKRVDLSLKSLSELAKKIVRFNDKICVVLVSENCVVASKGEKSSFNADEEVRKLAKVVKGDKNFAFGFNLKN